MSEQAIAATEQMAMPKHGEFCWNNLATNNTEESKSFYAELFGWKFKESNDAGMQYSEISIDGQKQFGGIWQLTEEMGEIKPHWMSWVAVDDVDAMTEKVKELGGNVCVPPTDIPNTGRFVVINDPTGATLSLITLKQPSST